MLSAPIQSSIAPQANNLLVNGVLPAVNTPAPVQAKTISVEANSTLEAIPVAGMQVEVFAGQLNEVLDHAEPGLTDVTPGQFGQRYVAQQVVEQQVFEQQEVESSGFEQPGQQQNLEQQQEAETWLQAMFNQQQLQLLARDATDVVAMPAVVAAPVIITFGEPSPTGSIGPTQTAPKAPALAANLVNENINSNRAFVLTPIHVLSQETAHLDNNTKASTEDHVFDPLVKTVVHTTASIAQTIPVVDVRPIDAGHNPVLASTSMATNNSANHIAQLAAVAVSEAGMGGVSDSVNEPGALTTLIVSGTESAQRSVQSQWSLHGSEAKWGEQLLHALRDNAQVQIQQKIQNATIRLDPPELGSLEIYLSHESGRLHVQITASQADVARLIQQTSDRLRQELSGPQFTLVNIQTSTEGQSGQQQSRERQRFVSDEFILANEQAFVDDTSPENRPGDVLVTV